MELTTAERWTQAATKIDTACQILELKGYQVRKATLTMTGHRVNVSLRWEGRIMVPWSQYRTDVVWGPRADVVLDKVRSLPDRNQG